MGLCFGKPCSRSAAVTHKSPEKRPSAIAIHGGKVVHVSKDHHHVSRSGSRREADLHFPATISTLVPSSSDTSKHCTFQQLLSREHVFELSSGPFFRNVELPSTKRDSSRDYRELNQGTLKNLSAFQNAAVEFQSGDQLHFEHSWSSAEVTVSDSLGDAESPSSHRGGKTQSTCENNDLRYTKSTFAVAGNISPLISSLKSKESTSVHAAHGSSGEIVEETGSELSVSNSDLCFGESTKSETKSDQWWLTAERVTLVGSRSSSQDVMSLEFLEELCRVSGVTSQSSSCSEADYDAEERSNANVMLDGMHSCTRPGKPSINLIASLAGAEANTVDATGVDLNFMDFLCDQGQVLAREIAPIDEAPGDVIKTEEPALGSPISKKRPSKSCSEVVTESATKKARFSNEENRTVALVPETGLADIHELDGESPAKHTYAETYHTVRASLRLKSAPSTPGSFPSTPFASVGSSFSLEDMGSMQKLVSPSTPASFASIGSTPNLVHSASEALTMEEMAAIWGAFEEGRMVR